MYSRRGIVNNGKWKDRMEETEQYVGGGAWKHMQEVGVGIRLSYSCGCCGCWLVLVKVPRSGGGGWVGRGI